MLISDSDLWERFEKANHDPYGRAVQTFARLWAEAMERRLQTRDGLWDWNLVREVAQPALEDAEREQHSDEGLTGFQFGCAVDLLATCWPGGPLLREWHNAELAGDSPQGRLQAARATAQGVTLNPAIMEIDVRPRRRRRRRRR